MNESAAARRRSRATASESWVGGAARVVGWPSLECMLRWALLVLWHCGELWPWLACQADHLNLIRVTITTPRPPPPRPAHHAIMPYHRPAQPPNHAAPTVHVVESNVYTVGLASLVARNSSQMVVHSLHIFDRKGKTLFSKTYSKAAAIGQQQLRQTSQGPAEEDPVDEQRKLVFGMLFSLRELVGSLAPEGEKGGEWRWSGCRGEIRPT